MLKAAIRGIGIVGGCGCGISGLEQALSQPPAPSDILLRTIHGSDTVQGFTADTRPLAHRLDRKVIRRTDHYTQMAILASLLAIEDAGMTDDLHRTAKTGRCGIILGTGYGSTCNGYDFRDLALENDIRKFSPISFANAVHNAAAAHIATSLGLRGPNLSINHFDQSTAMVLLTALAWLSAGRADMVLAGVADEFSKVTAYHQHRSQPPALPVGEGSVFFLLTRADETIPPYGHIQSITTGHWAQAPPEDLTPPAIENDGAWFIGTGLHPHAFTPDDQRFTAGYAPLYGAMPIGPAFEISIAALTILRRRFHPSALPLPTRPPSYTGQPLHCLSTGADQGWAVVTLAP